MEISEQCRNCGRTFDDYIKAFPKILDCPGYTQHYIEESSFAEEGKCLHRISLDEAKRQLDIIHERKKIAKKKAKAPLNFRPFAGLKSLLV